MAYSPVELRHVRFKRALFGYRPSPVDRTIEEVADSFETVWRERADYAERIEQLQGELKRHRELEGLLRSTLRWTRSTTPTPRSAPKRLKRTSNLYLPHGRFDSLARPRLSPRASEHNRRPARRRLEGARRRGP